MQTTSSEIERFGSYQLLEKLSSGMTTDVDLAQCHTADGRTTLTVLKRLRQDLVFDDGNAVESTALMFEARRALALEHPNIVQTLDADLHEQRFFRALEYVDGEALDHVLNAAGETGGLPIDVALYIVTQLLQALCFAHEQSGGLPFPHGDVRAHNVMISMTGNVKLADFGVSDSLLRVAYARQGVLTPAHAAPERVFGAPKTPTSDLYSVGVIMWECLAGRPWLPVGESHADANARRSLRIFELARIRPTLDLKWLAVCEQALAYEPARRYASAHEMWSQIIARWHAKAGREELRWLMHALFLSAHEERNKRIAMRLCGTIADLAPEPRDTHPSLPPLRDVGAHTTLEPSEPRLSQAPQLRGVSAQPEVQPSDQQPARLRPNSMPNVPSDAPPRHSASQRWRIVAGGAIAVVALLTASALFARAGTPKPQPELTVRAAALAAESLQPEVLFRMCGSNTVGAALAPALAEAFLSGKAASSIRRAPGTFAQNTILEASLGGSRVRVDIQARGSATAFEHLADGSCDIGMASRPISDEEVRLLSERGFGDLRSAASEHVVALDGVAMIVHANNPVRVLTRQMLHDIFTGSITDWSAVGGTAGPIQVLARDNSSGTFDVVKHLVLGADAMTPAAKRFDNNRALSDAVAADPSAIGFVGLPYVQASKPLAVGETSDTAMLPTRFTVATEGYLLARRLYLYTAERPRSAWLSEFVGFAVSQRGQQLAEQNDFIDLAPRLERVLCDERCPPSYAELTAVARRVSVDFRFHSSSIQLDSRASRDLDRLARFMGEQPGWQVLLLGFSDSLGSPSANTQLSIERARVVEGELKLRGVQVPVVTGFGASMPVSSNETEAGRQKNRRVEVWIRR